MIPVASCLAIIVLAWLKLRTGGWFDRLVAAGVILASAAVIFFVVADLVLSWGNPYWRGPLIGW